jgi:hypothetical protein
MKERTKENNVINKRIRENERAKKTERKIERTEGKKR